MHDDGASAGAEKLTRRERRRRDSAARSRAQAAEDSAAAKDDALDERTIVIDRGGEDDHTVAIDRGHATERTIVVSRPPVDERTVVVDRTRSAGGPTSGAEPRASDLDPSIADTIVAPPRRGESEAAPAIYKPRPVPIVPSRPPTVAPGVAPTRDTAAVRASVVRRDRRTGVFAVVSVAVAGVVSAAGLATLIIALLG